MNVAERFSQGDVGTFEEVFCEHQAEVYRWVMRIVRDPGAAEDLTIEAFWKIYQAHARFDPEKSFAAWARKIATNLALEHLRKHRREVPLLAEPKEEPADRRAKNSGARATEAARIVIEDLAWDAMGTGSVKILGKGRKVRFCPLWKRTMAELRPLIRGRDAPNPLRVARLAGRRK